MGRQKCKTKLLGGAFFLCVSRVHRHLRSGHTIYGAIYCNRMQFDLLSRECEREERKVGIDVKTISASTSKRVLAQCDKQQLRLDMPFYYYCEQDATKVITIYSVCLSLNGSGVCVRTEKGVPHSISISIINSTKNQRHLSATAPVVRR